MSPLSQRLAATEPTILSEPATARRLLLELLQEARAAGDQAAEAYALCLLGGCAFFQANYTETQLFARASIPLCQKVGLPDLESRCYNALGLAAGRQGNYDEALEAYLNGLRIANRPEVRDQGARSRVLINMASIYSELEDHERALELSQEGQRAAEQAGRAAYRADAMRGVIDELRMLERNEEALRLLPEALAAAQEAGFGAVVTKLYQSKCLLHLEARQLPEARQAAEKGMALAQGMDDAEGMAQCAWLLGECALKMGAYAEAHAALLRSEQLARRIGLYQVLSQSKRSLSKLMEAQDNHFEALRYLKEHLEEEEISRAASIRRRTQALDGQIKTEVYRNTSQPDPSADVKKPRD